VQTHFAHVCFPKQTQLGICDVCLEIQTAKKLANSVSEKRIHQQQMFEHTKLHQAERSAYEHRTKNAARCPDRI